MFGAERAGRGHSAAQREQGTEECSFFQEKMNTPPSPVHAPFALNVSERQFRGANSPDERLSGLWAVKEEMSEAVRAKMLSTAVAQHRVIRRFGKTAECELARLGAPH